MQKKLHIKKGDFVIVLAGDDKGQTGKVLEIDTKNNRAIVESVNMVTKHTKPNSKQPQGGRIEQEASIHISNLAIAIPRGESEKKSDKESKKEYVPTRVGRRLAEKASKDGKKRLVRYSKKSKKEIN
ncbi:MAG: 50S ribosomal protein L24 [Prevotellaceae bacterium]|jgi:large subunit ribosomal protein L24|nr:50S ribosomal protein L24 [Prevotellaceae bacterium]